MKSIRLYLLLYFTAAMSLDILYRCLDRIVWNHPPQWTLSILEQSTGYYISMALLPYIFGVTRRWPIGWSPARIGIHAIAVVIFAFIHTSLMWGSRLALSPLVGLGHYDYGSMPMRYFMEFPRQLISYAMWVGAYTIYRNWLRTKDLETQLVSARLENLSHQLQPHFLFNALNAVSATIYEDPHRADRMLERICDFLRATLRLPDSPMVPVSTELSLARQYLEVMKARLEDRLQFQIHCDPQAEAVSVPALLLQPLVENAVEHGQDPITGRLDIDIDVHRNGTSIKLTIRDHGPGLSRNGATTNGHGLANARKRIATVYGDGAAFQLSGHPEGGALVEIKIPA
jgi:two-component system, LytTR family, sensor kinase